MLSFLQPGHRTGAGLGQVPTPSGPTTASRLAPYALLAALALVFFGDLVAHPGQVLYSDYSDLLPLHLPSKRFLIRSWRETGELPRWCPYNFGGMPFIHDIQVSAFYPPHWPLFLFPEEWMGAALSWLVVLHVIAAGWCMHAYARSHGLTGPAALIAAVGYMFAGKWLLHLLGGGHYNMVPLAWLPLILLWLERGTLLAATWAGAAFSLFVLGAYPYITLYAGVFVALWTLGPTLERAGFLGGDGPRSWRRTLNALGRWVFLGGWTALIAVGLGAVQLLPGLEMAHEASRSSGVSSPVQTLTGGARTLAALVGPALANDANWLWEDRAGLGLLWLVAAVLAPVLCRTARIRFEAVACLLWIAFALAGVALVQGLPGFRLFQLPSRMLLLAALPVALLAGRTTQALFVAPVVDEEVRLRRRRILLKCTVVVAVLLLIVAGCLRWRGEQLLGSPYWLTLAVTVPGAWFLLGPPRLSSRIAAAAWLLLLFVDLAALALPYVSVRPESEIYAESNCTRFLAAHRSTPGRVFDVNPPRTSANSTPLWPGLPAVLRVEPIRGFNPIDVLRYKEYLQFMAGSDEPLRPIDRMYTSAVLGTFPIENSALADLLGIRYLLLPADIPLDAVVRNDQAAWALAAEDASPSTFAFIPDAGAGEPAGFHSLGAYRVYENTRALPRAFLVSQARALPRDRGSILPALKTTDFRRTVLVEDDVPAGDPLPSTAPGSAEIRVYQPNCVTVQVDASSAGYLVLTDLWYPGWTCSVDGAALPIHRANYLFRAVAVPAGAHEVVFTFDPASYRWGKGISLATLALVCCLTVLGLVHRNRRKVGRDA